jgi:voltage-gated potassium channel
MKEFFIPIVFSLEGIKFCFFDIIHSIPMAYKNFRNKLFWNKVKYLLMPTRIFSGIQKENENIISSEYIKDKTKYSLVVTLVIIFTFIVIDSMLHINFLTWLAYQCSWYVQCIFYPIITFILWRSISRVLEIFYAFYRDAHTHLVSSKKDNNTSGLQYHERIKLALYSYAELIFLYALIFYIFSGIFSAFSALAFKDMVIDMIDAVYFSGVTITTLGYGDILPNVWVTKLLAVFEVLNGFALIIVSFTVYVSRAISEMDK